MNFWIGTGPKQADRASTVMYDEASEAWRDSVDLEGARRGDGDLLLRPARVGSNGFHLLHDIHALDDLAEDNVLAVQP